MYQRTRVISLVLALFFIVFHLSSCFSCGRVPLSEEEKTSLFLIGDAIEGQYVANNLHFAAAIAFILMIILLTMMALVKYVTAKYVYGGEQ